MSKRSWPDPLSRKDLRTCPLAGRRSKLKLDDLAVPHQPGSSLTEFLRSLPDQLAARDFHRVVEAVLEALGQGRPVVWGMGGHVIKVGLSRIVIDLMERGAVRALAFNGAGAIHDFELAWAGGTSEDVPQALSRGDFGMADETGKLLNRAINRGVDNGLGLGRAIGEYILAAKPPHLDTSLLAAATRLGLPVTVHVALGTDVIHVHPEANGASIGQGSLADFELFCAVVRELEGGGVYFNIGSAVILPEVFLKAVTLVRNLGHPLSRFTTVDLDFLRHYRPTENVLKRPTADGGTGIRLTGHHELMLPLLAAAIVEGLAATTAER